MRTRDKGSIADDPEEQDSEDAPALAGNDEVGQIGQGKPKRKRPKSRNHGWSHKKTKRPSIIKPPNRELQQPIKAGG